MKGAKNMSEIQNAIEVKNLKKMFWWQSFV